MQVNKATEDYQETVDRVKLLSKEFNTNIIQTEQGVFVEFED